MAGPHKEPLPSPKLEGLEIMRACAALMVFIGHGFQHEIFSQITFLKMIFNYSTEAVIIFFVLSGAVIALRHTNDIGHRSTAWNYFIKRLIRIYPIFLFAIILGEVVVNILGWHSLDPLQFVGNLVFLQDLGGHIVPTPEANRALWSLAYEMTYYLCFMLVILLPSLRKVWWFGAIGSAIAVGLIDVSGFARHFLEIFALSGAWLFGFEAVRRSTFFPPVTPGFGISCLAIGLIFARCPVTENFYDPFRLLAFAALSTPLVLSLIQTKNVAAEYYCFRIPLALIGIALLWATSNALIATKLVLTPLGILTAIIPVSYLDKLLVKLRSLGHILVPIGGISYALYAVHTPLLFICKALIPSPLLVAIAFVISSLMVAYLVEAIAQPPLSRFLRQRLLRPNIPGGRGARDACASQS